MLRRRLSSVFHNFSKPNPPSSTKAVDEDRGKWYVRKGVSFVLITVTGGVALSALDDLAVYHSSSRKALEKAISNQEIKDALGEPIVKGRWYNASLAVAHKRQSVSCTFPVSGPLGTGVLQFKAIRNGENGWFSVWGPLNWDVVVMDALVHVPGNDEKHQTFRISLSDNFHPSGTSEPCRDCMPRELDN